MGHGGAVRGHTLRCYGVSQQRRRAGDQRGPVAAGDQPIPSSGPLSFSALRTFSQTTPSRPIFPLPSSSPQLKSFSPSIVHTSFLPLATSKTSTICEYSLALPASNLQALSAPQFPLVWAVRSCGETKQNGGLLGGPKSPNRRRPRQSFPVFALPSKTHQSTPLLRSCFVLLPRETAANSSS